MSAVAVANDQQTLPNTQACTSAIVDDIPIELFTRNHINFISAHAAGGVPLLKGTLLDNEKGKHPNIIDVTALQKKLKVQPGCLTYAQFLEAKENYIKFQTRRDSGNGSWIALHREHFDFFTSQDDAEVYYHSWKELEVELRRPWRINESRFPMSVYLSRWISMVDTHGIRAQLQAALEATDSSNSGEVLSEVVGRPRPVSRLL
ncbi:hypothetical protein CVT24_012721 [Panaeolus cyanescens]|uniref:Uncharacterized protein n=1 Tax=Panaeolus cyanescens TaxID=181874 RepID=A0A409W6R7_9AGAR|nr:hypothetical protein CVT24_012721 [Panaeolus cyanescens]